ncbi:MAG: type II toxin-antitoxin system VapC family toxin [Devosia sp.]
MSHVLLDTHVWAWSLTDRRRLSERAVLALQSAETVSLSVISLYEIGQKVRLGKWPEMANKLDTMIGIADLQGLRLIEISATISIAASAFDWPHRDPFDRLLAGTAIDRGLVLVSADTAFDELAPRPGWPGRVW